MSAGQRLALLAAAAVVLVGGFLVAQGSSDDDSESASTSTPTEQQPATTGSATTPTGTQRQEAAPQEPPPPRVETIRIRGGQPVGEPPTLTFEQGETIRLRFRSDAATEVHIHGFDEYVQVPAGGSETARLKADIEGIFEVEDHGSAALLAKLEIRP